MKRSNSLIRNLEDTLAGFLTACIRRLGKRRPRPAAPAGPRAILVCKWAAMGDAILSLYALRELKSREPGLRIEVLVSSRIRDVYAHAPGIDAVHVLPITGRRLALELLNPVLWIRLAGLVARLRARRFAEFVDLELYRTHGILLKRMLAIPFSRGFDVPGAPPKGHDAEAPRPKDMPEWQCFYAVLGLDIPSAQPVPLYGGPAPRGGRTARRIGIAYGSSFNWPQKKWPWEHYAETMTLLAPLGCEFVLLGSAFEREDARRIKERAAARVEDTSGTLDYAGLMRAVAGCDLVVGNDTGTLHLASACGVPTVTIFGPTNPRKWNGLTSTPIFLEDIPCRPCYYLSSMPPCSHFDCLRKLKPDRVAEQIRAVLGD